MILFKNIGLTSIMSVFLVYNFLTVYMWSAVRADYDETVQVTIPQGIMEGRIRYTSKNLAFQRNVIKYYSFEGIPYAQPPIGNLRFKNPVPFNNWTGVYDATKLKSRCSQITDNVYKYEGNEDCLFVNVYTRNLNKNNSIPVIVIIHGGAFRNGAGDMYSPLDLILEINTVIVTFNYRLHILGLMSLNNKNAPGNVQNKDQVLALRWVNTNIKYFGGDPNNVVLYGPSSGASNAYLLHVSPMARGLFHKSVLVSGASLCSWYTGYEPISLVKEFGLFLGLKTNNTEDIYEYLMKLPVKELTQKVFNFEFKNDIYVHKFSSTLEVPIEGVERFLPISPLYAYKTETFSDLPMMITFSSLEYTYFLRDGLFENYFKKNEFLIPQIWKIPKESKCFNNTVRKIKNFYFGSKNINFKSYDDLLSFTLLMSDITFTQPTIDVLRTHAKYIKSPLYVYRFAYRGGLNNANIEKYKFQGATHCDDINYLDRNITMDLYSSDNIVRQQLLTLYRNFFRTSNPTPGPMTHLLPFVWPPYTFKNRDYLSVSGESVISQDPDGIRAKFWSELEESVMKEGQFNKNWRETCIFG